VYADEVVAGTTRLCSKQQIIW